MKLMHSSLHPNHSFDTNFFKLFSLFVSNEWLLQCRERVAIPSHNLETTLDQVDLKVEIQEAISWIVSELIDRKDKEAGEN